VIGLFHTVDLYRPTTETGGYNETKLVYPTIPTRRDVRCRICTLSTDDREKLSSIGGSVSGVGQVRIHFEGDEDIELHDRVMQGTKQWEIVEAEDVDGRGIVIETIATHIAGVT